MVVPIARASFRPLSVGNPRITLHVTWTGSPAS